MALDRIFFDARFIRWDHHDGISRFSAGLFDALHRRTKVTALIFDRRQLLRLPKGCDYLLVNEPTKPAELFIAAKLNRAGAKFVFSPMQTMGTFGRKYKLVLTLHDLIYYNHPTPPPEFSALIRLIWRLFHAMYWPQRLILNRADVVATVSRTSRELIRKFGLTKRPVEVIYNAAGTFIRDYEHRAPQSRPRGPQKLIYMGSFMDYKNVEVLVRGMSLLPNYELHLLSRISPERKAQLQQLVQAAGGFVFFHNGVSEAEYHEHLDEAVALVTGSQDEGFGIPLVESMSRGVPVVVSSIPIFNEIGGDAAIFFDQSSPDSFAAAVKKLESHPEWLRRSELSRKQAAKFNWDHSAGELIRIAKELID
jgi:glycosyltransferase involved in cell wall biosynthesis